MFNFSVLEKRSCHSENNVIVGNKRLLQALNYALTQICSFSDAISTN